MKPEKVHGCWVLTKCYNEFGQSAGSLTCIWQGKPSVEELCKFFETTEVHKTINNPLAALLFILHIQKGGGRQGTEHSWYELELVEYGKSRYEDEPLMR